MLIECIIRRDGGTKATIGQHLYHFKPHVTGGPHIAEVANPDHARRFLSIPEAYSAVIDEPWDDPSPERRLEQSVEPDDDGLDDLDREALDALHDSAFGVKPKSHTKDETIRRKLREHFAANATQE